MKEEIWKSLYSIKPQARQWTIKRMNKLKLYVWNDEKFWFDLQRKPEEIPSIIIRAMQNYKILK